MKIYKIFRENYEFTNDQKKCWFSKLTFKMMFEIKDGLMVKINESDKTASITKSPKATGNICVPCFYEKENIKYKIISIEHNAF